MPFQLSDDETCSDTFFCGAFESLRSVNRPVTAITCDCRSIWTLRSYRVTVKASRSTARATPACIAISDSTKKNFFIVRRPGCLELSLPAAVEQLRTSRLHRQLTRSVKGRRPTSGSTLESRNAYVPGRATP